MIEALTFAGDDQKWGAAQHIAFVHLCNIWSTPNMPCMERKIRAVEIIKGMNMVLLLRKPQSQESRGTKLTKKRARSSADDIYCMWWGAKGTSNTRLDFFMLTVEHLVTVLWINTGCLVNFLKYLTSPWSPLSGDWDAWECELTNSEPARCWRKDLSLHNLRFPSKGVTQTHNVTTGTRKFVAVQQCYARRSKNIKSQEKCKYDCSEILEKLSSDIVHQMRKEHHWIWKIKRFVSSLNVRIFFQTFRCVDGLYC